MVLQMAKQLGLLRFVLIFPSLTLNEHFHVRDLPGSGRRIDILCRSLAACFDWGPTTWPRKRLQIAAIIGNRVVLEIDCPETNVLQGEVFWALEIRRALSGNPPSYIAVKEIGLADYIDEVLSASNSKIWALEETGIGIAEVPGLDATSSHIILIGDHEGYSEESLAILSDRSIYRISLGRTSYLGSHCIAAIIGLLERKV